MRHLISIATAACAVAALSACSAAAEPPRTAPTTQPAPAGSTPAATEAAGTRPATAPASAAAPKPAAPKPAAPKPATPSWKSIDWKSVTAEEMPNCPRKTEVDSVRYADLTGDGRSEAIVAASCWTNTSQNPINVFVYDGADRRPPLDRLLRIGEDQYLKTATVRTRGATVTVTSEALSDDAPRCCPDLLITQKYEWRDSAFHRILLDEKPLG
jgi:hypothetical protein